MVRKVAPNKALECRPCGASEQDREGHLGAAGPWAFEMTVGNDLDRFHLVIDVIDRVPSLEVSGAYLKQELRDKLIEHNRYICTHGEGMPPDIRD